MNWRSACLIVPALCAAPALAFAQGSVTLYGLVDAGIDYTSNVGGRSAWQMASGFAQGSRWGLKGTEDLGGGYSALFQIENGFNVNSGTLAQGGRAFGRQAYVGLAGERFGTLTLGRQYDSVVDYLAPTTANGSWGVYPFSHPLDNDNTGNTFRVNNTVKYASPDFAGFSFGGTYGFSNDTNFANNRQWSIGAQYEHGGLLVGAAFLNANNPGATPGGAIAGAGSVGADANFVSARLRIFGAGINYTAGPATVGFAYTNSAVSRPSANVGYLFGDETIQPIAGPLAGGTVTALKYQNFEVNGKYQFTPAFFVGAQYVYTLARYEATTGSVKPTIHSIGLMADYALSKRTDVYLTGAYQKVAGDATGSSLDQALIPGAPDLSSTSRQLMVHAGIRHKF
ncbi:porin [Burkholderia stagnalis]|uniref:porin n=1 Tax=Burkholderia stagnalis TaxID=1503054 RepID=UPI00075E147E|nr:porin [Burkholderia stagnalis]KVC63979.1 porin [Burkholderia stagnalis]KVN10840.1 porin [Burkholderia stagnalis]KWI66492.1 porin [Burkholderia stagnalis]KWK66912.1 porin [Burkholderia stagnalis]KWN14638.1 porin [Burkholderia stagnalis]